jgi:hypothetical protein
MEMETKSSKQKQMPTNGKKQNGVSEPGAPVGRDHLLDLWLPLRLGLRRAKELLVRQCKICEVEAEEDLVVPSGRRHSWGRAASGV